MVLRALIYTTHMGKSNKKARSDRINALRKQYDAFLEEDRKRKERNEFILGKLDKMRYNSALVPMRHKFQPNKFDNRPVAVDHLAHQLQIPPVRDFQPPTSNQHLMIPNISVNNIEDTYLIQEISKKYILIPKVRSTFTNSYMRNEIPKQNTEELEVRSDQDTIPIKDFNPTSSENTDWKSKYEILNLLKKEDNDKQSNCNTTATVVPDDSVHPDIVLANKHEPNITSHCDNHPINGVDQFPEKDLSADPINYEFSNDNEYIHNTNMSPNLVHNASREYNSVIKPNHDQIGAAGYELQDISYNSSDTRNVDMPEGHINYLAQSVSEANVTSAFVEVPSDPRFDITSENINIKDEIPVEFESLKIHEQNEPADKDNSEKIFYEHDEVSPSQGLNTYTPVNEINFNSPPVIGVTDPVLGIEPVTEISYEQEFRSNNEMQMKTDTNVVPKAETDLDTSSDDTLEQSTPVIEQTEPSTTQTESVTEEPETVIEQTENQMNINESIEDFETEQREMFYSEQQADETYANQQADTTTPYEYPQNEYPQNQDYTYSNTETVAYSADLTDETLTQKYDPNYEQQYGDVDRGAEHQQYVQQHEEKPLKGTSNVDPEYQMMQYEQEYENQGTIEQTLESEEGYEVQPDNTQLEQPDVETEEEAAQNVQAS